MNKYIAIGIIVILIIVGYVVFETKTQDPQTSSTPTASTQNDLATNCRRELPAGVDDSSLSADKKMVTVFWGDDSGNYSLVLPYSPETDFAGCSESMKAYLRHLPTTP